MTVVLDTSAVLAVLWREPGAEQVDGMLTDARICAVNLTELVSRLVERGASDERAASVVDSLALDIVPFDAALALDAGLLRRATRAAGLSLGDRACLALARRLGLPALTADRAWSALDLDVEIELIR